MAEPKKTRGLALAGVRGILGLIGVGVAGASIAAATLIPLPHVGVGVTSAVVSPVAATQQRICAGPVLRLGGILGDEATTAVSLGWADVTHAATLGTAALENMEPTENESNTPSRRLVLPPPPAGQEPGALAGSQSQSVVGAEIAGFAASECTLPTLESWLVGGSTTTGRTTLISLNNPSKVSSTVKLTIYSEGGQVEASGTGGIIVPPGGRSVLSLAGFAPDITSPVVKVESVGGQVSASLQQSTVRTLTPGGIDVVSGGVGPSPLTIIPGIVVDGRDDVTTASTINGYGDVAGTLRVLVPGQGPAEVTVTAIPETGSAPTNSSTLSLQRGTVTEFPLGEFTDGTWTLTVASDHPAVAAVRTSTITLSDTPASGGNDASPPIPDVLATDFAWYASAPTLTGNALVSVAAGPSPMLHLMNTGTSDADITIAATEGAGTTVTVPAGEALAVPVAGDTSYQLGGFDTVRVSVSYQGEGALSGFVVHPPSRGSHAVTVFTQYG